MGQVASQSESLNRIAERVITCDDIRNRAQDLVKKLLSQLICYALGRSKVGRSLLEF